jgi:hypothetical protein
LQPAGPNARRWRVRESTLLIEALERIRIGLPFALRALDVDNGTEFINETLIQYCLRNGI